jgi:hypothetical protein
MNKGLRDPSRDNAAARIAGGASPPACFAPSDNLFDAIRADVATIGGGVVFEPLLRPRSDEPPFSDIDEANYE